MSSSHARFVDPDVVVVDDTSFSLISLERSVGDVSDEISRAALIVFSVVDDAHPLRIATATEVDRIRSKPVLLTPRSEAAAIRGFRSEAGNLLLVLAVDVQFSAPVRGPFGRFESRELAVDWSGRRMEFAKSVDGEAARRLLSDRSVPVVFEDCGCRLPGCDGFWESTPDQRAHLAEVPAGLDLSASVWTRDDDAAVIMLPHGDVVFPL
jgi:hypothetical protein